MYEACRLLFVYGTLRRDFAHPLHRLLAENALWLGEARFQGRLYSLGDYPGVVPSGDPADSVVGEVYEVLAPDLVFPSLDDYEDHWPANETDSLYLRRVCAVRKTFDFQKIQAWVYLYNRPVDGLRCITSGDWLKK